MRPLCREARRIWLARLTIHRRAGRITALHVEIARALLHRLGFDGRLDPSHDRIARDAACSSRTVKRALARLAELGLLTWQQRAAPGRGMTSNAYVICPDGEAPEVRRLPRPVGQAGRRIIGKENSPLLLPPPEVARQALERVRAAMAVRLRAGLSMTP